MNLRSIMFLTIVLIAFACNSRQVQKPQDSQETENTHANIPSCTDEHPWGFYYGDDEIRSVVNDYMKSRPGDAIGSFHAITKPVEEFPDLDPNYPHVTYRFERDGTKYAEKLKVEKVGESWKVVEVEWTCRI